MKINPRSVDNFINNNEFKRFKATLFYGNNIGLVKKRITRISENFFQNNSEQEASNKIKMNFADVSREPDLLLNETKTLSFFGSKKIILISEASGVVSKQLEKILLEENNPDALIIFYGGQLAPKDQVRKLFETSQELASIPCYLQESFGIEHEVLAELKKAGITSNAETIKYVVNNLGGDSASISTEIDKLVSIYKHGDKISTDEVKNIISKSSRDADCDKYISFLMKEDFSLAEAELEKLMLAGTKPSFIIRMLSRYFTRLYLSHGLIAEGTSEDDVPSKLRPPVFFKNIPTFKLALKKYSASKIMEILEKLLNLEIKIKTHDTTLSKIICEKELFSMFVLNE